MQMADDYAGFAALAVFAALDSSDDEQEPPKKKRTWSRSWLLRRKRLGCYENLMRELALEDLDGYRRWIRMDTAAFEELLLRVRPLITKRDTNFREAIDAGERLAITLRYLAEGTSQSSLEFSFRVARNTISKIVHEVCIAIYTVLRDDYVKTPRCEQDWCRVAQEFWELWQFPNCLGALDGKHIAISPPPQTGSLFRNYKGTFSIVLMALVDADLKFLYVDVGRNGRMHDSGIWNASKLKKELDDGRVGIPAQSLLPGSSKVAPYVVVADEAFGLKPNLMRPFPARDLDLKRRIYNYR